MGLSATTLDASVTTALSLQRQRTTLLAASYAKELSPRETFFIAATELKIRFFGIRLSRIVPTNYHNRVWWAACSSRIADCQEYLEDIRLLFQNDYNPFPDMSFPGMCQMQLDIREAYRGKSF